MLEEGEISGEEGDLAPPASIDSQNDVEQQPIQAHGESRSKSHRSKRSKKHHHHREKERMEEDLLEEDLVDVADIDYSNEDEFNSEFNSNNKRRNNKGPLIKKPKKQALLSDFPSPPLDPSGHGGYSDNDQDDDNSNEHMTRYQQMPSASSLLELFGASGQQYADSIVVEKENNRPAKKKTLLSQPDSGSGDQQKKKRALLGTPSESEMTVSVESIEKKVEKKLKYSEIQKEKQKKQAEQQKQKEEQLKTVPCHFFAKGQCTKGDKCPFKHSADLTVVPTEKKLEICKYYLNSYCAKGDKCTFMHGEFPCKFFHNRNGQCSSGDKCRFSHAPITNPALLEAFERYLRETTNTSSTGTFIPNTVSAYEPTVTVNKTPLLGSPPSSQSVDTSSNVVKPKKTLLKNPEPPQSYFNDVDQRTPPRDIDERMIGSSTSSSLAAASASDIDIRLPSSHHNLHGDIDIRGISTKQISLSSPPGPRKQPLLASPPQAPSLVQSIPDATAILEANARYESAKKELSIRIIKAMNDDDGGIFSQIPKQTLTDLLVKLLNANSSELSLETIQALLVTMNAASSCNVPPAPTAPTSTGDFDLRLGEYHMDGDYRDYTSSNATMNTKLQRRDYDQDQVINGMVGEFNYQMIEILIEPSKLWTTISSTYDSHYLDSLGQADQEIDPRIKYYSNKSNLNNVKNFQNQLAQKEQLESSLDSLTNSVQAALKETATSLSTNLSSLVNHNNDHNGASIINQTPTSPNSSKNLISNSSFSSITAKKITDPRLLRSMAQQSSASPFDENKSAADLLSLQNKTQLVNNNLLSSLPDISLPQDLQRTLNTYLNGSSSSTTKATVDSSGAGANSTVKLSIADYKRKLQKPVSGLESSSSSGMSNSMSSMMSSSGFGSGGILSTTNSSSFTPSSTTSSSSTSSTSSSSLPGIPSYTFNLQAPQSLHELLKNFQS